MRENDESLAVPASACRAAALLGRTVNRALGSGPLTPPAYRLMSVLSSGSLAAAVLADKLAVSRPAITNTTDWLVERGLATRDVDPSDRRRVSIAMTDSGEAALTESDRLVAARLLEVLSERTAAEQHGALATLELLFGALNEDRVRRHLTSLPDAEEAS